MKMSKLLAFATLLTLTSCTAYRYVRYNFVGIEDYKIFPSRPLLKSNQPFKFFKSINPIALPDTFSMTEFKSLAFTEVLKKTKTVSYLIIRNDSILYQWNDEKYGATTPVLSFSMAKSITSILYGCAINDGIIKSVNEPVINYVPELKKVKGIENLKIEHLLNMKSGLDFDESYINPFGKVVKMYYGRSFLRVIKNMKFKNAPGEQFKYQNGDTQLLGLILTRALNGKSITDYCNEKIWGPLQMENNAMWNMFDKDKLEKTFCGIGATAIDYAKIGRLYLKKGLINNKQLVPLSWINQSWTYGQPVYGTRSYTYQWWGVSDRQFVADGHNGQYIFSDTEKNVIIVRLGYTRDNFNWMKHLKGVCEKL